MATYTETTNTHIGTVKVTTRAYDVYVSTHHYADREDITEYTLRDPKDASKYWVGAEVSPGVYEFHTNMGTRIKRRGIAVKFFIAGDMVEVLNA